jgi:hypothetical protein
MTLPLPSPSLNTLERALWYTDRLIEAGTPYDVIKDADVRELADMYRAAYEPVVALEREQRLRLLRETAA